MNDKGILAQLARCDSDRMQRYRQHLDFYRGRQWETRERWGEKQLTFNYARVFIDKIASYLMSGMALTVEPVSAEPQHQHMAQRVEQSLQNVYRDNNLEQLDFETEIDCAVLGDACYKVTWDAEQTRVRVTAPDVQGLYAWWRADDLSRVWKVASRYEMPPDEAQSLYGITAHGKTVTVVEVWTDTTFELYVDDALYEQKPNPYGFIPFVIYPNLREPKQFWGSSDMPALVEPQKELNRALSQVSRILELSGNPVAVLENVEESEDIAVRPGAVWNLPEEAKAYLLDLLQGGGIRLHIEYIELLYRALHDISESPRASFGGSDRNLSGVAMQVELYPLLQKVRRKRLIRTAAYRQRSRFILTLLERYTGLKCEACRPEVIWGPVLPQDVSSLVSDEQTLVQSGIHSRRRAMGELGITDTDLEFQRWLEERRAILAMNKKESPVNRKEPV